MARRNDFPYGAPQPNMGPGPQPPQQPHHPGAGQPPMNVGQQPPSGPPSQQQTPTPTPAQPNRPRKRNAPGTAPSPANAVVQTPVSVGQVPTVPAVNNAPGAAPGGAPTDDASAAGGQPPTKKSRTNTPWTPQEELRLKQMRDAGNSWAEIAKVRLFAFSFFARLKCIWKLTDGHY